MAGGQDSIRPSSRGGYCGRDLQWTGVPVTQLTGRSERLLTMEQEIGRRLIGQDRRWPPSRRAIQGASRLQDKRPLKGASCSLAPPGSADGLARCLARFLFGSDDTMIRLDMSEFMERHESQAHRRLRAMWGMKRGQAHQPCGVY